MASVSISHVVLFIAAVAVAALVAGTATNVATDVSHAIRGVGEDYGEELDTDFSIISDPGANAIYDESSTTVTLLVKNTGSEVLPTDPELVDVLLDGRLVAEANVTVVDGEYWRPGNVARITLNTTLSEGPHRVVVRANEQRSFLSFPYRGSVEDAGTVVFAGSLNTIAGDGGAVTTYLSETPSVIGPATVDFDGDGSPGAPYVNASGALKIADANSVTLLEGVPESSTSKLAVGRWNGSSASVFFGNTSGVYRVAPGESPVRVGTTAANAVAGVANFDDDPAAELVFLGSSNSVKFLNPDGSVVDTQVTVGSNARAIGAPVDFDGDGRARVPFVSSSNNVKLAGYRNGNGYYEKFSTPNAAKWGVGSHDVDDDGQYEVVYVDGSSNYLRFMDLDGSTTRITNATGDPVTAEAPGVA